MAPRKIDKNADENVRKKPRTLTCGVKSPGPAHMLKPLVGYKDHCLSRYRNPAYTIGRVQKLRQPCLGPGPKYYISFPLDKGFFFTRAVHKERKDCSPGPKYMLPDMQCIPKFSIVGKPRDVPPPCTTLYDPPKYPPGPAYTFGGKAKGRKCEFNPPMYDVGDLNLIKPRAPTFNIQFLMKKKDTCNSPGPKYYPKLMRKAPAYTFGLKHSECKRIPRTECDELC